jgi:hypothetical protein
LLRDDSTPFGFLARERVLTASLSDLHANLSVLCKTINTPSVMIRMVARPGARANDIKVNPMTQRIALLLV